MVIEVRSSPVLMDSLSKIAFRRRDAEVIPALTNALASSYFQLGKKYECRKGTRVGH